jgi:hypothetical protein
MKTLFNYNNLDEPEVKEEFVSGPWPIWQNTAQNYRCNMKFGILVFKGHQHFLL